MRRRSGGCISRICGHPVRDLDALRGCAPSLEPADLMGKLVHGRRGGYCYEHNTLFSLALEALGFGVTRLTARVVGADRIESRPRTHMALLVEVPGEPGPYLADVGFGAIGALLEPVPLMAGREFRDAERRHRLVHVPDRRAAGDVGARGLRPGQGRLGSAQYAFTLEPFEKADFDVINWHMATNPRSPFTGRLYVQRVTPDRHLLLHGRLLPRRGPTEPCGSGS